MTKTNNREVGLNPYLPLTDNLFKTESNMNSRELNLTIDRVTHGELKNFYELYYQFVTMIRAILYKLGANEDLEDLTQDVFVKIARHIHTFDGKSKLKTWIYRVATNTGIDALRKKKLKRSDVDMDRMGATDPESDIFKQELIQQGLNKLGLEHRSVLILAIWEELSLQEIADMMNIPEGTVKSRLYYAKEKMARYLSQKGIEVEL